MSERLLDLWLYLCMHVDAGSSGIIDHSNVVWNAAALDKIHVSYLNHNHNLSDPLTRNISVTNSWQNCHPVPDHASGTPGYITYLGNAFINTTCTAGEVWPAEALDVMREAGVRHATITHSNL